MLAHSKQKTRNKKGATKTILSTNPQKDKWKC